MIMVQDMMMLLLAGLWFKVGFWKSILLCRRINMERIILFVMWVWMEVVSISWKN